MDASTEGMMKPLARARTQRKAAEKLIEIVKKRNGNRRLHAVVSHSDVPEQAEKLRQQLLSLFPVEEIYITDVSLITVIHDGPGALRLGWYSEE
jgi:fatty acid-binding protein DegV